ncbi:hypothetical protein SAMN04487864_10184 [Succiniclasticum ruminis]|uniref:Uncharacterized protein n=1 Tax=Succiniclasticum ruminis TaxID=40841 RepID=A0A1G6HMC0_9FIRM|nr:hypothetical protein SAMN04487864_10184 [Succiniclasticum ruminis]
MGLLLFYLWFETALRGYSFILVQNPVAGYNFILVTPVAG